MSVSQKPQAPRVPDWDANEILEHLAEIYDSPAERREALGLEDGQLIDWAYMLEPDEGDMDRQMEFLDMVSELDDDYQSSHWVNEEDVRYKNDAEGKVVYYGTMSDPENDECWIMVSEVEYVEK